MEFFERLYRGFEAEHYVAGKLFSVGYEAFKLPADFGTGKRDAGNKIRNSFDTEDHDVM